MLFLPKRNEPPPNGGGFCIDEMKYAVKIEAGVLNRSGAPQDQSMTQGVPSFLVNLPVQTLTKSTSQPMPKQPAVSSQMMPVPIFPARKR